MISLLLPPSCVNSFDHQGCDQTVHINFIMVNMATTNQYGKIQYKGHTVYVMDTNQLITSVTADSCIPRFYLSKMLS